MVWQANLEDISATQPCVTCPLLAWLYSQQVYRDLCTLGKHTCIFHAATHAPLDPHSHFSPTHLPVPLGLAHTLETSGAALAVPRRVLEHSSSHDTQDTVLNAQRHAQMVTCAPWRHPLGSTVHGDRGGTPPVSRATPQRLRAGFPIALSGLFPPALLTLEHCVPAGSSLPLPPPPPALLTLQSHPVQLEPLPPQGANSSSLRTPQGFPFQGAQPDSSWVGLASSHFQYLVTHTHRLCNSSSTGQAS